MSHRNATKQRGWAWPDAAKSQKISHILVTSSLFVKTSVSAKFLI